MSTPKTKTEMKEETEARNGNTSWLLAEDSVASELLAFYYSDSEPDHAGHSPFDSTTASPHPLPLPKTVSELGETRVFRALVSLGLMMLLFIPLLHDTKRLGFTMLFFIIFCGVAVGGGFLAFGLLGSPSLRKRGGRRLTV